MKEKQLEMRDKMFLNRGKIKVLNELWNKLSVSDKECIINREFNMLGAWSCDDWWAGMTCSEKTDILVDVIKNEINTFEVSRKMKISERIITKK